MWAARLSIVDWIYFKTPTLLATSRTRNQSRVECLSYLWKSNICHHQFDEQEANISIPLEIISLDAGLRMDGVLALDFWDVVIEVLRSTSNTERPIGLATGNWCGTGDHTIDKHQTTTPTEKRKREVEQLSNVDYQHTFLSRRVSAVYIFEDNEAVIKMFVKGRSPTMRHVSRTDRVALDWLFDRIKMELKIQIK